MRKQISKNNVFVKNESQYFHLGAYFATEILFSFYLRLKGVVCIENLFCKIFV